MNLINILKYCVLLACLMMAADAFAKPRFKAPPKATVEWVSPDSRVEGMELKIRKFVAISQSVEDVLAFYRNEWKDQAAEIETPPWMMIGTKRGKEYWNVQVQENTEGGSWGYLSISDLPDLIEKGKPIGSNLPGKGGNGFPKMSGSTVINDHFQKDIGRNGRVLMIENDFSVSSNASFYKSHYESRGYKATIDQSNPRKGSHVLYMNNGNKQVSLVINQIQGKTNVTANEVTHGF